MLGLKRDPEVGHDRLTSLKRSNHITCNSFTTLCPEQQSCFALHTTTKDCDLLDRRHKFVFESSRQVWGSHSQRIGLSRIPLADLELDPPGCDSPLSNPGKTWRNRRRIMGPKSQCDSSCVCIPQVQTQTRTPTRHHSRASYLSHEEL